jgi:ATP-binding cassette subfamily F protein 3
MLSGGERVRLALCKIFMKKPNFLILDEPTNHLDIVGKETLEDMLDTYAGTIIFVSHDRYFIKKVARQILCFNKEYTELFGYGYEQYLENEKNKTLPQPQLAERPKGKKKFTTPLKEISKKERAIGKTEEKIAVLEEQIDGIKTEIGLPENQSDYIKLSALQDELEKTETELDIAMTEWEKLTTELEELKKA